MVVMEMKYMAVVKGRCIAVEERVSIAMGGMGWQGEWVWCRWCGYYEETWLVGSYPLHLQNVFKSGSI